MNPEYEMIGHLIQGEKRKPKEMTQLHESLEKEMVAAQLRQKEYYDQHRKPNPNLQSGDMGWLLPRNINTTRPSKKCTTRKSDYSKSWRRLEQALINWPYHPQWPYTTHSISHSTNPTKTTDLPLRSKNLLLLFR